MFITVKTHEEAMRIAGAMLTKHALWKDADRSERAGYPIYENGVYNEWVSDLGDRLEVNQGAESMNIWIDPVRDVTTYDIEETARVINEAIYEIDDKICDAIQANTGIGKARELLYAAWAELADIVDKKFPESDLVKRFNMRG